MEWDGADAIIPTVFQAALRVGGRCISQHVRISRTSNDGFDSNEILHRREHLVMSLPSPLIITGCKILREYRCSDDPLDIFDAYAHFGGHQVRVHRRWFGQGPSKYGDWLNSRVVLSGRELDYGDDPRIFIANSKICVLANIYSPGFGFRNHLIESDGGETWTRYYLMPPAGLAAGKNWSPFTYPDGRIAFIHSFSPLRILREVRRERGIILLAAAEADGVPAEEGDGNGFPAHRGGTNGVTIGQNVFGIGHTTRVARSSSGGYIKSPGSYFRDDNQLIHRPFFWRLNVSDLSLQVWELDYEWDQRRWVIDPTSLILSADNQSLTLFTTEVDRSFVDPTSSAVTKQYPCILNAVVT